MQHLRNIVIVRHGQTTVNVANPKRTNRFYDNADELAKLKERADHEVQLTTKGRAQARAIGSLMREKWPFKRFGICCDSGYVRTVRTLDLILDSYPDNKADDSTRRSHLAIRERDAGYPWTIPRPQDRKLFPWWDGYYGQVGLIHARPPGGESIADAWLRVHMFLDSVRLSHPGQNLLVVTHARIMVGFKYWLENRPSDQMEGLYEQGDHIGNCEAWWYKRDTRKRRYGLKDRLMPGPDGQ